MNNPVNGKKIVTALLVGCAAFFGTAGNTAVLAASATVSSIATQRTKCHALRPGDTIGVVAPSSCTSADSFDNATRLIESHGYKVKIAPSCTKAYGYFAGTDYERAADLNNFFRDDEVKAILCLRGGYGSARILDQLDYEMIAAHPKFLIGYSDVTALHAALGERSSLVTVHAPMFLYFNRYEKEHNNLPQYTEENFFTNIASTNPIGEITLPKDRKLQTVNEGVAEGIIVGGNLSIIASLVGTPYELSGKGALLFIEDAGEPSYKIDRLLQQLWQNGLLSRVNGILLGDFIGGEEDEEEGDFTKDEVLEYYARLIGKPVIKGLPAGHGRNNMFLPLGVHAIMVANDDGTASLCIDEAAATP